MAVLQPRVSAVVAVVAGPEPTHAPDTPDKEGEHDGGEGSEQPREALGNGAGSSHDVCHLGGSVARAAHTAVSSPRKAWKKVTASRTTEAGLVGRSSFECASSPVMVRSATASFGRLAAMRSVSVYGIR